MKILFAPQSTSLTHVGRSLSLARALHEQGHEIVFIGQKRFLANPRFVGEPFFEFVEMREVPAAVIIRRTQAAHGLHSSDTIRQVVKEGMDILRSQKPDLMIGDLRPTMFVAARAVGVPSVSLLNVRWFPKLYARPFPYPSTLRIPRAWKEEIEGLPEKKRAEKIVWLNQATVAEPFAPVLKDLGLEPVEYYCDLLEGDLNLLLDTAFFAPTVPLDDNFHQVGPIFWHPPWDDPEWLFEIPSSPPLVYVTFGSFAADGLFVRTAEALAERDVQAVIHTMRQEPPLEGLPERIRVVKEMKDEKIFSRASFVISNGGNQTVYESIWGSAPMLCVASHVGQEFVAEDVQRLGLGLKLTILDVENDPKAVSKALDELFERKDEFAERIKLAKEDLACYDGLNTSVERILERFG